MAANRNSAEMPHKKFGRTARSNRTPSTQLSANDRANEQNDAAISVPTKLAPSTMPHIRANLPRFLKLKHAITGITTAMVFSMKSRPRPKTTMTSPPNSQSC
jgi:hypothetical protein